MMTEAEGAIDPVEFSLDVAAALPKSNRIMAPFMWYGGKGNLVKQLRMPPSKVYVEPYCGAASVFWHLTPRPVEVLNDLHSEIINLYRVLQDVGKFRELAHRLVWTPYSVDEFRKALADEERDDVGRAWAMFVRQNQGFGGHAGTEGDWGRVFVSKRGMAKNVAAWRTRLACLPVWHARLGRVQLDSRDALEVVRYWDGPAPLFYLDPPYVLETRVNGDVYQHEQDDAHHRALVELLLTIEGQAVLSGYDSEIYAPLAAAGWGVKRIETVCSAAGRVRGSKLRGTGAALEHVSRTEVVWTKENRAARTLF